jgi:hypothetical protein
MRRNVLDWISETMTDATSAVVLTHNIDFLFVQSILQPTLRKCGSPKLTIFADAGCAAGSFEQQRMFLRGLGRDYRVVVVDLGVGRRFHPKAILLSGPSKAALAIGSGNLTHGGLSANQEIWVTFESDSDDGGEVSAFREYLGVVRGLSGDDEAVRDELADAFDADENPWVTGLQEPSGLLGAPNVRPILDRMIDEVGSEVERVVVHAPYFDPEGAALGELAGRINGPVQTLVQRNHVGLGADAANSLPENVEIVSIDTDLRRFVHAKLYAFRRASDTLLVCGSANVSRAALLSSGDWGNAELVSVKSISHPEADEVLGELILQDEPPDFPETPPSAEWDVPTSPVRLLSASHADGMLRIRFKLDGEARSLTVITDDETSLELAQRSDREARVSLQKCPKSMRLRCRFKDGREETSAPMWVDDEAALGKSVPERRLASKVSESLESGSLSAKGMFEILQLLNEHVRHSAPPRRSAGDRQRREEETTARPYDVDEIFSDDYGRLNPNEPRSLIGGFSQSDFLAAFSAYFSLNQTDDEDPVDTTDDEDEFEPPSEEPKEEENIEARETRRQRARQERIEQGRRLRGKLLGAINDVAKAMASREFVEDRPPQRLGADIAATALLLKKAHADEIIGEEDFAKVTGDLWTVLFFGTKDEKSVIHRLSELESEGDGTDRSHEIASPQLSAALTFWCAPNWGGTEPEAVRFRFASMLLAARFPWLVSGGTTDEILIELSRLARVMPTDLGDEALGITWRNWLRAGVALAEFESITRRKSALELAQCIEADTVSESELLWQAGEFYIAEGAYRREKGTKALVKPVRGGASKKFTGNMLVPIVKLLGDDQSLDMYSEARKFLFELLSEVDRL